MEQYAKCAKGLKENNFGQLESLLGMLLSGDGRILMKMRNVETLHLKTAETGGNQKEESSGPKVVRHILSPGQGLSHHVPLSL